MSDLTQEFQYEDVFRQRMAEARAYVENPIKLKDEITQEMATRDSKTLYGPMPDPFAYRMMRYRGFLRFPERLENLIVSENEPLDTIRSFKPIMMDVEPVSRCNFRCIMCTMSDWGGKRAQDLTFDAFKDFIQSNPHLLEIKLQGIGEPLLHKHFCGMIKYVADRDIWVRTTVNGSLLHLRDNYQKLIDSGVGEVQTSFDGASKEVFEKIRRYSDFDLVVENLTLLNRYANQKDRPYTRMWVVLQKHNRHQVFEFADLAKKMEFRRLTFSVALGDWGKEEWHETNQKLQAAELTSEEQKQLAEFGQKEGIDISLWGQAAVYSTDSLESLCPAPFKRASFSSDMRLVPCSRVGDPGVADLGDASAFDTSWNGTAYQAFRQAHLNGDIPDFCKNCYR